LVKFYFTKRNIFSLKTIILSRFAVSGAKILSIDQPHVTDKIMNAINAKSLTLAALAALTFAASGVASATTVLTNQYAVTSSATQVAANEWTFDYTVTNNNQGIGGQTGFDGFSIYVPTAATVVSSTAPLPFNGAPGYWSQGSSSTLDLRGDGSQNLAAEAGYNVYTWWGQNTQSVYTPGSTASFSITLSNVSLGSNTAGLSTYFGYGAATAAAASNQYGNYSTFTTDLKSPVGAVPEPETYAMLLAGLGLVGYMQRRKAKRQA
jgi:hypothetical protein